MCGRARCSLAPGELRAAAGLAPDAPWVAEQQYQPTYNAAPGAWLPVLRTDAQGQHMLHTMRWGLVPSFTPPSSPPDHWRMFNARAEGLATKSVFSRLLVAAAAPGEGSTCSSQQAAAGSKAEQEEPGVATGQQGGAPPGSKQPAAADAQQEHPHQLGQGGSNRVGSPYKKRCSHCCVVLLNGFYEWKAGAGGRKQPYYISCGQDAVLRCAGLWDTWTDGQGEQLHTFTIVTVEASPRFSTMHDRMPALLRGQGEVEAWLGSSGAGGAAQLVEQLCRPYGSPDLNWHPVTPAMNKLGYDSPDACADVRAKKGAITSFFKPAAAKAAAGKAATTPDKNTAVAAAPSGEAGGPTINTDADSRGEVGPGVAPKRPQGQASSSPQHKKPKHSS